MKFTIYLLVGIPLLVVFYLGVYKLVKYMMKKDIEEM